MNKQKNETVIKIEAGEYTFKGYTILKDSCGYEWMVYETGNGNCAIRWFDTKAEAVMYLTFKGMLNSPNRTDSDWMQSDLSDFFCNG